MRGFIEVTSKYGDSKVLVSVSQILLVDVDDEGAYVAVGTHTRKFLRGWGCLKITVTETYEEVRTKIAEAINPPLFPDEEPKQITKHWEELNCIFDNLCYDDIPEDKRPANYDEKKEKVFTLLDEAIEILKELGL